jgi:hypothetical protein
MRRNQAQTRTKVIAGTFDPALWTIATVLSAAAVCLARLI